MASYIAIFLCIVVILFLSVLLIKFKKLFSTESKIEEARKIMNKMIADINNNANRDMDLINDSSRRVRALLSEADQKMEQFKQATNRLRDMIAITEQIENQHSYQVPKNKTLENINPVGQNTTETQSKKIEIQNSLFDDVTIVTPEGAAYKEVPVITTKIFDEMPVINKKEKEGRELNEKILRLFNQGLEIEEIAKKLSCSITEVQYIIDMQ